MREGTQPWRRMGLLPAAVTVLAGCTAEPILMDPRAPPPRIVPPVTMPSIAPAPGLGRVVLHSTDGALRVSARADTAFVPPGRNLPATRTGELCVTPCVVDLPPGEYKLFMTSADDSYSRGDTDVLLVREGLTYYVRAPGRYEPRTWIPVVPSLVIVVGAALILSGAAMASSSASGSGDASSTGVVLMAVGGGIGITGGVLMYNVSRARIQNGATTSWWMPPQGQSAFERGEER